MYKLLDKPWGAALLNNGNAVIPLATLEDEFGGVSHIILDDDCFVLINGSKSSNIFSMTPHWYKEAAETMKKMQVSRPSAGLMFILINVFLAGFAIGAMVTMIKYDLF